MATTITETLDNDLRASENEDNLIELFNDNRNDESGFDSKILAENTNNIQNEFFYRSNQDKEVEKNYSSTVMETIEEETCENLGLEIEIVNEQFDTLESISKKDNFFRYMETYFKSYSHSYILDNIEEEWEDDYEEEEEDDTISHDKESEKGSEEQITPLEETVSRKTLTIEERTALVREIRSARNYQKILKMQNNYLHYNCCAIFLAYSRMDTVDKGLDQAMVLNDMRYKLALEEYAKAKSEIDSRMDVLKISTHDLEKALLVLEATFNDVYSELICFVFEKALALKFSRSGRRLSVDEIQKLLEKKKQRSFEMSQVRINYIQCQNILLNLKVRLRNLKSLEVGLTSKYYEKLLLYKQNLVDRIEEQRENTRKLEKKYFIYPTVLNYLKESSSCTETGITDEKNKWEELKEMEDKIQKQVVDLGRKKTLLRTRNHKLQDALGLLKNPLLIKKKNELDRLKIKFSEFKKVY